ncbi:DNA polymerase III subunit gamma and tau [Leucobacter sp. W1478]|uniref:DNA polymerase III subunit gamma and tau n=1 Tax=Leucobacter sp. W1478 TaxID=3439065 RepID=UPI003F411BE6
MATALYRRYRPESFSEMIGQAHVTDPLMTALRNGRIGHAYLFSGPRGCGKTSSARVLARCLNCAEGPTDTPCGVCPSCIELSREGGGSLDVVEIDAASHGGVDDARDLRERAVFAPARDRFKIFIIDEAHMVTPGGFNALLKIVEEPPPHVKFIFATTEPEKVIGTIRSRTHHYPFRLIAPAALIEYTQTLCASEGVEVEPGVLPLVVRAGGGSVRDTLSILDQLIAGSEESRVSTERAAGLLGFTSSELLGEVVVALAASDASAAFHATDRVVQTGQDPRRFVEDLLERLRDLIVVSATSVDGAAAVFRGVPEAQLQRMFEQTQAFGRGELSRLADTVSAALDKMTGATAPRLHLELMIARALVSAAPRSGSAPTSAHSAESSVSSGSVKAPSPGEELPQVAASPSAVATDIISTMRSAREFLRSDSAGAGAASLESAGVAGSAEAVGGSGATDPLHSPSNLPVQPDSVAPQPERLAPEVHPVAQIPGPVAAVPGPVVTEPGAPESLAPESAIPVHETAMPQPAIPAPISAHAEPVTLDELREVWSDLLEEILESDREAWNAVRPVVPLELRDDVLTIGVASKSDLESFKSVGAGPLREAISAAIGLTVRYVPKQLPSGAPGAPAAPSIDAAGASDGRGEASEDPDPVGTDQEVDHVSARLSALLGGLGAAAAKSPAGKFGDATFTLDRDPHVDPGFSPGAIGEAPEDPYAGVPEEPDAELVEVTEPAEASRVAISHTPTFTRYGEAVVREVLGAKFIEEIPLSNQYDS